MLTGRNKYQWLSWSFLFRYKLSQNCKFFITTSKTSQNYSNETIRVSKLNICVLRDVMDKSRHLLWSLEQMLLFEEFWEVSVVVVKKLQLLKSVQVMVRLHILMMISFLAKMLLSFLLRDDNFLARNESIGKICKRTITWMDFSSLKTLMMQSK